MRKDMARHLHIRGRVQGVNYRESMHYEAERLGVAGWVRNRSDGSVEAVVDGEPWAVDAITAWARIGPRSARVDAVEVSEFAGSFSRFERLPDE
jgi:acylphosphatase